ncbi:antibiotic synthetase [Purpureocillium lilacinum]|uniref:Antibiotic synthetase n=1 Tax=Purpureocillium lilacinum TaxID=33203 RepID=A0A179GJD4_PURLI|nr:antibiotic synthetase [Purpureocillium lilacinum]OAQ77922.1 antibiotic synthetase [Purpureocillium lilacinum]
MDYSFLSESGGADIGQFVAGNASRLGSKTAIVDKQLLISYSELDLAAKALALELLRHGIMPEDPVGILTSFGAHHIVAQLAVAYAGATCVPLDPIRPDRDLELQLQLAKSRLLITDESCHGRGLSAHKIPVVVSRDPADGEKEVPGLPRTLPSDFRSHILFTSGTTGKPKGVQIHARGIMRLARDETCKPDSSEEVIGHLNNTCFDLSLVDTWVALLHGATIIILDRQEALSPDIFARTLKERQVTYLLITAALFRVIAAACPMAFSECKTLILGAEAPDMNSCKVVLENGPPGRLINGYGPTESCILALAHVITLDDVAKGFLPIGKPINQTVSYVLDESLRMVAGKNTGELYLGGQGLSRGYLDNPEATQKAFIPVSGLTCSGDAVSLYRTGDLAYTDDANNVVWLGRKDREVKIRGYRINLDVIETELYLTGLIKTVAAVRAEPLGSNAPLLVACITYASPESSNDALLAEARARLPSYMVPQLVQFEKMPLTPNGKVDRKEAHKLLMAMLHGPQSRDVHDEPRAVLDLTASEKVLRVLWSRSLFTVPEEHIRLESDFFTLGATSLHVASLIAGIRAELDTSLPARQIYEHSTLHALASLLDRKKSEHAADDLDKIKDVLRNDAETLWRDIPIPKGPPVDWLSAGEGKVFLTGATGFVGAYLLFELIQSPEVRAVRCLVRAKTPRSAFKKLSQNFHKYRLPNLSEELMSKVVVVPGDLSQARLGLSEAEYHELATWTSIIYHLAAQVNYNEPYTATRDANISGTLNILRLAVCSRSKPLHYTSSIAAFGPTGLIREQVKELSEDDPLTPYLETTIPYEMGYGQSQWVSDEVVSHLMRRGFPAAVYRLGVVLCNSGDGVGNPDDFASRLLADCLRLGIYPSLPDQRKELLPVDYVASAMRLISLRNDNLGKAYHITPDAQSSIDMNELFRLAAKLCHVDLVGLPYAEWVERLRRADQSGANPRLKPLLPMLEERVYGERARWELYEGMARFKNDNTAAALKKVEGYEGLRPAAIDANDLRKYFHFLLVVD